MGARSEIGLYYGIDIEHFTPADGDERRMLRARLASRQTNSSLSSRAGSVTRKIRRLSFAPWRWRARAASTPSC